MSQEFDPRKFVDDFTAEKLSSPDTTSLARVYYRRRAETAFDHLYLVTAAYQKGLEDGRKLAIASATKDPLG